MEKRCDHVVFVVKNLDMQSNVFVLPRMCPILRYRTELAHRASVAKDHTVQQRPFNVGNRDSPNVCQPFAPSDIAACSSSLPLLLHERNKFASHKWERHEDRSQNNSGVAKDDLQPLAVQPRS